MILYLGNKLSAHGFTPTSVETLGLKIQEFGEKVVTKSDKRNPILRLLDMSWNILIYRNENPLIVIDVYSTTAFWFAWTAGTFSRMLHLSYVLILRGGNLPHRLDSSPFFCKSLFNKSFKNIAVSGYLKHEFEIREYPVELIHNYLDIQFYPLKVRENIQPRLLWVRSFHKIYNPQLALQVLKQLTLQYAEASLCMVGPDKDGHQAICMQLAKELNINVTFTGKLCKQEWINLSSKYDIFINTTNVDNTPVSVMEAMALGMPVVTTNAGGIPYLFQDCVEGIMVGKDNVPEMTAAILSLLKDPVKTKNISIAARKKAEQWDWKIIGPSWKNLIEQAIS